MATKQKVTKSGTKSEKLIKLPLSVHRVLKIKAAEQGLSMGELIGQLLK